ncbi:MAG: hypothetical protein CMP12_22020 [Zunongwangia sp.]|nr:hypothetical protein [Zunongwangia sp.]MAS71860.1 hypothetical protein [Zunongwangia sp.]
MYILIWVLIRQKNLRCMKLTKLLTQYGIAYYSIFLLFLLSFSTICSAQDIKERKYATTFQASSTVLLNRDIKNANAAVDQNLETYAQMNTLLSLSGSSRASLRLRFGKELPAGTPVTLKVGSESQLLSLLDNVTIQAVNGVGSAINNTGNTVGNEVRLSSLASLLSGPQQREITFVPSVAYDGVKISLGGLAASFNVYEAFYYEYTGETGCPEALDILYGVSGNGLDVASLLNVVRNPSNAIDGDDNSRAELRANVSLLEEAFLEVPFNRNSLPGESARIVLQGQATGLLDLSLLSSSVEIKAFLNGQELADIDLGSSLVSLSLLGGSSDKQVLSVPISQSFDKIRISVGRGLLETLSGLNIYEIGQSPSKPELTSPSLVGGIVELCAGGDLTLSVVSPVPGSTYRWYSVSSGGSPVYTGTDYELSDVSSGSYSYYVSQSLAGCTTESERTMISVEVEALPDAPQLVESSIEVASGGDVTFEVADADAGLTYNWYAEGDTSTIVHTGETYELTDVTASSGYSVVAVSGSGCISLPTSANITLLGDLLPPKVVPATATISEGESVSFMASSDNPSPVDYVWFDEQGDEVFVGDQFTTPSTLVPGTYTYEVISRDPVTNQVSTATQVTLVVEAIEALVDCSAANAQGNGISGLLCIGCGVSNAGNAVDNDPNNFSRLTLGVGVSGSVYQELIFPQSGVSGDSIRLDLAVPGGLADVGVLGGIQVTLYNGTTQVQQLNVNDALVNLSLLSGNRFNAIFEAKNTYDRVEIRNTGLVSALTSVDIYGAYIVVPEVEVDNDIVEICAGETINFDIITETGLSYSWYDAPTGGTLLATGGSFTTSEINTSQIFYLEITRNSCLIQERIPFEVDVLPTATAGDLLTTNFDICAGGSVELAATSSVNNATIRYYTDADLTMQLTDLEVMPTQTTTYYVTVSGDGVCENLPGEAAMITVNVSDPGTPTTDMATQSFCAEATVADLMTNEGNVVWYADEEGDTLLDDTEVLVDGMTYYAGFDPSSGCASNDLLAVRVNLATNIAPTIDGLLDGICLMQEVTYTTDSGKEDYLWDIDGGEIVAGGELSDNSVTVRWTSLLNTSVSVSYMDTGNCSTELMEMIDVNVVNCSDLALSISVDNLSPMIGDDVTFTIRVDNLGNSDFRDIMIRDIIDSGYRLKSVTAAMGEFSMVSKEWSIPMLRANAFAEVRVTVEVLEGDDYMNMVELVSSDPVDTNAANNEAQITINPICLLVYNEFTPNNDGSNDVFRIDCIENYPNNKLEVYNRYGDLVYETRGYQNDWDGTANKGAIFTNKPLPVGTYYYVLKVDGRGEVEDVNIQGWLYIMR